MCLPLRCWAKGRRSWHIVSLHCNVDKTIFAGVLHGWLVFRGEARRSLHCTVDMHKWHTMCLPLRCSAKGRHSWHIVSLHCNVDKTISAGVLHGWLVFGGEARRNLHCTVDMHMWHTICLPLRCSARGRHSCHIWALHYSSYKANAFSVWHGGMTFEGVVAHNLHCKGEMHTQCTKSLGLHLHARVSRTLCRSSVPALALPCMYGRLRFEILHCSSEGAAH